MVTTESGLQYKDIKVGQGPSPPVGFQVMFSCVCNLVQYATMNKYRKEKVSPCFSLHEKVLYLFHASSDL